MLSGDKIQSLAGFSEGLSSHRLKSLILDRCQDSSLTKLYIGIIFHYFLLGQFCVFTSSNILEGSLSSDTSRISVVSLLLLPIVTYPIWNLYLILQGLAQMPLIKSDSQPSPDRKICGAFLALCFCGVFLYYVFRTHCI